MTATNKPPNAAVSDDAPVFFLVAGEASGDLLGARLMDALRARLGGAVRFQGVGGPRMQAQGLGLLFDSQALAHMGFIDVALHLPDILHRMAAVVAAVKAARPAALITIDAPDFSFRVVRRLKGQGIKLIHYVAPTVWAWRPGRAKKIAALYDHLMTLLPFEPPYFTTHGLAATFVGHPLVEGGAGRGDGARLRAARHIGQHVPVLAVLPGSRAGEVRRLLPVFAQTLARLRVRVPDLQVVVPLVPAVAPAVRAAAAGWGVPVHFVDTDADKYDALAAAHAALACSGTVSVELALAGVPTVIAYRMGAVNAFLVRLFVKTRFATLINIMKDRAVMPEFIQGDCTAAKLAAAVERLLTDPAAQAAQKAELGDIAAWLGRGQFVPSDRAAHTVLSVAGLTDKG